MEKSVLVIIDDDSEELVGVLTLEGKTRDDFNELFREVKEKLPGEWSWEDVLDEMTEREWNFCWDDSAETQLI